MTFKDFYVSWYSRMKSFAREYVISDDDAEDIVQDVFLELYEKYDSLSFRVNMPAYVFTTVKNRCIDHLRRKIVNQESVDYMQSEYLLTLRMKFDSLEILDDDILMDSNLEERIENALNKLPEKCRIIFIKHKIEGMKLKEIAEELQLSSKTIENQMTIAYKKLKEDLKDYYPMLALFFSRIIE
ncbi:MAG: RNA polymerase sigma-70 factor [Tannerella sp.]|nr:RNA polymerase sigma-70 factor [Tannerella sp.]